MEHVPTYTTHLVQIRITVRKTTIIKGNTVEGDVKERCVLNKDIIPTIDNRAVDSGTFHPWAINSGNLLTVLSRNPMFEAENVKAH